MTRTLSKMVFILVLLIAAPAQGETLSEIATLNESGSAIKVEISKGTVEEVKAAIEKALDTARVMILTDNLLKVRGVQLADLEKVEVELLAVEGDDLMLGEGSLALDMPDGSASIRARKADSDLAEILGPDQFIARVVKVERGRSFPKVRITVRVIKATPEGEYAEAYPKNTEVILIPVFRGRSMRVEGNFINAGANYLQEQDKVRVTIDRTKGNLIRVKQIVRIP